MSWFHASPQEFEGGTVLIASGGPSPFDHADYRAQMNRNGEGVWVSPELNDALQWRAVIEEDCGMIAHVYEVEPRGAPIEYPDEEDAGHIVESAIVIRKVFDAWTGML